MIDFSILVCSIFERRAFLNRLLDVLEPQLKPNVELLVLNDNVKRPIGTKRNNLMDLAQGKYFCFIDDDDLVVPEYVDEVLAHIPEDPDTIVYDSLYTENGQNPKPVKHGKDFGHYTAPDAYYRRPNHKMVHKRSIVVERFQDISFGEDDEWAARHLKYIKTEARIDKVLYLHEYSTLTRKHYNIPPEWRNYRSE